MALINNPLTIVNNPSYDIKGYVRMTDSKLLDENFSLLSVNFSNNFEIKVRIKKPIAYGTDTNEVFFTTGTQSAPSYAVIALCVDIGQFVLYSNGSQAVEKGLNCNLNTTNLNTWVDFYLTHENGTMTMSAYDLNGNLIATTTVSNTPTNTSVNIKLGGNGSGGWYDYPNHEVVDINNSYIKVNGSLVWGKE
ncbi:MAG: hypothetical protein J6S67_25470 [Methanobrevibacter sp.]|nr:hypothetical protein [Methanobrevibacter sp.]